MDWAEGTPVRIDAGNGRYVDMTVPGPAVFAALERVRAASAAAATPDPADVATVTTWLESQQRLGSGP